MGRLGVREAMAETNCTKQTDITIPVWWLVNEISELEADACQAVDKKMHFTAGKLFGKAEAYKEILESEGFTHSADTLHSTTQTPVPGQ